MTHLDDAPDRNEPPVQDEVIVRFWNLARSRAGVRLTEAIIGADWTSMIPPPSWAFGSDSEQSDRLLGQVLDGTKTATSSAFAEYEEAGARLPEVGEVSIVLDGAGHPGALIRTTNVEQVGFGEVDEDFALLEGESSLAGWREAHRKFFADSLGIPEEDVGGELQVVAERFTLLYPRPDDLPPIP